MVTCVFCFTPEKTKFMVFAQVVVYGELPLIFLFEGVADRVIVPDHPTDILKYVTAQLNDFLLLFGMLQFAEDASNAGSLAT